MSHFTEKDRLLSTLQREKADRAPVICTGGMMNEIYYNFVDGTELTRVQDLLQAELELE